ncbi:MAG: PIN domain-containing protein, partial [Phycisphaerae bacterium]|nr:PIN domain-containing protein [Phycisphaerae bacterium]
IMDVAAKRRPFDGPAAFVWKVVEERRIEGVVSAVTLTTLYYLTRKFFGKGQALEVIDEVRRVFMISPVTEEIIDQAIKSGMTDFEDAVQLFSGLSVGVTHVVTRDQMGFKSAPIPVIPPEEFPRLLQSIRP